MSESDAAYEAIRRNGTDVERIARQTGLKPRNVLRVKEHLLHDEHLLDRYVAFGVPAVIRCFDSDLGIAAAWRRLTAGTFTRADLQLLRHEAAEAWYMRRHGPSYDAAHNGAQRRYPAPLLE